MPIIACPTCGTKLEIDADQLGKEVECGSCQQVFQAKRDSESSRGRKSRSDRDDEEDDRPSKRRKSKYRRDEEEDDDRPRRRSRRDDDSELDDDYSPRASRNAAPTNGSALTSMILGIIALVIELPSFAGSLFGVFCCCFGLAAWIGHAIAGILGLVGLILALVSGNNEAGRGSRLAGLIMCPIAILLALLGIILPMLGFAFFAAANPPGMNPRPGLNPPPVFRGR